MSNQPHHLPIHFEMGRQKPPMQLLWNMQPSHQGHATAMRTDASKLRRQIDSLTPLVSFILYGTTSLLLFTPGST